jgi:nucleotide-binding universal stress UspA family protein
MSEVVLVVLQRPDTASGLLRAAERLAGLANGAHVNALAVTASAASALKAAYDDWLAIPRATAFPAHWHVGAGDICDAIQERGSRADLVVIARPVEDDGHGVRQEFRAALLKTGRPVLVVPPGNLARPEFGRRVAIAWRQDEHTVKAVLPALRYVAHAERVFLLAGTHEGWAAPAVPQVLAEREVAAELHLMPAGPGRFGEALLSRAHELGADLLIIGAYAHSPLHNLVYGGVTRFMLGHADLPVLMRY